MVGRHKEMRRREVEAHTTDELMRCTRAATTVVVEVLSDASAYLSGNLREPALGDERRQDGRVSCGVFARQVADHAAIDENLHRIAVVLVPGRDDR